MRLRNEKIWSAHDCSLTVLKIPIGRISRSFSKGKLLGEKSLPGVKVAEVPSPVDRGAICTSTWQQTSSTQ